MTVYSLLSCSKTSDSMTTVPIADNNSTEFTIDPYEAKIENGRANSESGLAPEVSVDFATAKAACESAGKRLCTSTEWVAACKGAGNKAFAFQESADEPASIKEKCDVARTENNTPGSLPSLTGAHPECKTEGLNLFDMVGNLAEWTIGPNGTAIASGAPFYFDIEISGCAAQTTDPGEPTIDPGTKSTDVGFRCCRDKNSTATGTSVPTFPF